MIGTELSAALREHTGGGPVTFVLPGGLEITGTVRKQIREGGETVGAVVLVDGADPDDPRNYAFMPASSILATLWEAK